MLEVELTARHFKKLGEILNESGFNSALSYELNSTRFSLNARLKILKFRYLTQIESAKTSFSADMYEKHFRETAVNFHACEADLAARSLELARLEFLGAYGQKSF